MSPREAACPSCGAPLEFRNAATLVIVCDACRTAVYRSDADLEAIGKMPEVALIDSVLSLGASGRHDGRAWHVIGQVQLDHGTGPWNEWCLRFDDGDTAWLAEAQGELILTREQTDEAPPAFAAMRPGAEVLIAGSPYTVAEMRVARVTAAQGEFPERVAPGDRRRYADLRGDAGRFATVSDDSSDAEPPQLFVGRVVTKQELGVDDRTVTRAAPRRAATDRYACPKCGSPITLRDPEGAVRFTCGACGHLLEKTAKGARVVQAAAEIEADPRIALGTRGRLRELDVEVIAFITRSVVVDGMRYPWREYLLRTQDGGYRWLVDAKGHWSFVEPLAPPRERGTGRAVVCEGRTYRHFQGGEACVDHVLGEMYWACEVGETVRTDDFVHVDGATGEVFQVSREGTDEETVWSRAHYLEPETVAAAFGGAVRPRQPSGVAINQPNRRIPARRGMWRTFGALAASAVVLWIFMSIHHANHVVTTLTLAAPHENAPAPGPGAPLLPGEAADPSGARGVVVTDEFEIEPAQANVAIHFSAVVENKWAGVDGALVNVETGDVHVFAVEAQQWSGVEDGYAWSEGDRTSDVRLGSIPRGRYALRLQAVSSGSSTEPAMCRIDVRSQVASTLRPVLLLGLLLVAPVLVTLWAAGFESARWAESDHAPGGDG